MKLVTHNSTHVLKLL